MEHIPTVINLVLIVGYLTTNIPKLNQKTKNIIALLCVFLGAISIGCSLLIYLLGISTSLSRVVATSLVSLIWIFLSVNLYSYTKR